MTCRKSPCSGTTSFNLAEAWMAVQEGDSSAVGQALGQLDACADAQGCCRGRAALLRSAGAMRAGDAPAALALLTEADLAVPPSTDPLYDLERQLVAAGLWSQAGQHEAALAATQLIRVELEGSGAACPTGLAIASSWLAARILTALHRYVDAEVELERCIQRARDAALPAWELRSRLQQIELARRAARAATDGDRDSTAAWKNLLSRCAALAAFEASVVTRAPQHACRLNLWQAEAFIRLGDLGSAAGVLDAARCSTLSAEPLPPLLECEWAGLQALWLSRRGDHLQATAQLTSALATAERLGATELLLELTDTATEMAALVADRAEQARWMRRHRDLSQAAAKQAADRQCELVSVLLDAERTLREAAEARAEALEAARDHRALEERNAALALAAKRDHLTGLANRRQFEQEYGERHALARQRGLELPLAVIDVDHFKRVNDTHGHPVGDAVLRKLGALLQQQCRQGDLVARWGGEEFVIVFGRTTLPAAMFICERIRSAVHDEDWDQLVPDMPITVSLGLCNSAASPQANDGVKAADGALYRAKATGRDRLCVAESGC